jgi:glyoxylase-like metal-dependent hydrolase (beta-lactamase superfamily II)
VIASLPPPAGNSFRKTVFSVDGAVRLDDPQRAQGRSNQGEGDMLRTRYASIVAAIVANALAVPALAQQPAPAPAVQAPAMPPVATTKVADNVYIFRYVGHQSMFVVTPAGVIATDPISLRRPAKPYIDAIRAVTKAPIKYVIYSHSHFDHTAGGQPFKDLGATFIAQRNAKARMMALKRPDIVIPDEVVDDKKVIKLGGTTLELLYVGKNHSDSTLVMRLPKEKIIFTVDWIPVEAVQFRGMADTYVPDIEEGLKKVIAMDWETLIPGHPGPGGKQTGTKQNARDQLAYLQDLSAAVKKEVEQGKTYDQAVKDISLPKYQAWPSYKAFLPMNIERYYDFWNRGI